MNTLFFLILRQLADGKFHSGEALAQHFKVTRTSIWHAIKAAQQLGVSISAVHGRGYRLPHPLVLLDAAAIDSHLAAYRALFKVIVLEETPSTNRYLMQNLAQFEQATCVAAQLQTQGRGRRGRVWQSALGESLTFSVLWQFNGGASALSGLSLVVGVALIRALRQIGVPIGENGAQLKWPNDVLIHGQKLAGILIELQGDAEGPSRAVIGVGVNVRLSETTRQSIDQAATDLYSVLKNTVDVNALLGAILQNLALCLAIFDTHGFKALRDEWHGYHAHQNKTVHVILPDESMVQGIAQGVAEDGVLLLETAAGVQRFLSGEVSLRGHS